MGAIFAQGTQLKYSTDGGSTYVTLAHAQDFGSPDNQRDLIEVTDHDSPGGREEHILGLIRSGELTFKVNYDPAEASHSYVSGFPHLVDVGDAVPFRIVLVDDSATQFDFSGLPRRFMVSNPVNGVYTADCSIKPTGAVTVS